MNGDSERAVYEIADVGPDGILVDVLGTTLNCLVSSKHTPLKWTVFDLEWLQKEDGILQAERVSRRSELRPTGWRLDDGGIRLFHSQCLQVINGLFLAGPHFILWEKGATAEALISTVELGLQVLDSSIWLIGCQDEQLSTTLTTFFRTVTRRDPEIPSGA